MNIVTPRSPEDDYKAHFHHGGTLMTVAGRDRVIDRWHLAVMEPDTLGGGPKGGERATTFQ